MFRIVRVDRSKIEAMEQLGTKRKFWFREEERRLLFKAEERDTGEDWAEKVACQLCAILGLPHVHYELAEEWDGERYIQPGVVCETCSPPPTSLILGNQLLMALDPDYPANEGRKYRVREHTIDAVADVMRELAPPSGTWMSGIPPSVNTALDVFIGYVMLDAWIANQDRHHENWGALLEDRLRLAPTFDHGASLARNLLDTERKERLETSDRNRKVAYFAQRARSAFYTGNTPRSMGTVAVFFAFARLSRQAALSWIGQLATFDRDSLWQVLNEVPNKRMSNITKKFTVELLLENQRRLLEGISGL